jgi:hypothetical protein
LRAASARIAAACGDHQDRSEKDEAGVDPPTIHRYERDVFGADALTALPSVQEEQSSHAGLITPGAPRPRPRLDIQLGHRFTGMRRCRRH